MDNVTNNNTMMRALQRSIPSIKSTVRLRCAEHILNLVVKAVLYGDTTTFSKAIVEAGDEVSFHLWHEFGAIGRVHNVVKWIMRSDQGRQTFMNVGRKRNRL